MWYIRTLCLKLLPSICSGYFDVVVLHKKFSTYLNESSSVCFLVFFISELSQKEWPYIPLFQELLYCLLFVCSLVRFRHHKYCINKKETTTLWRISVRCLSATYTWNDKAVKSGVVVLISDRETTTLLQSKLSRVAFTLTFEAMQISMNKIYYTFLSI